ncbi:MAG: HD domain-containing protein [Planctomycetia bacterium]|jgi:GTP pyrophosphokinase
MELTAKFAAAVEMAGQLHAQQRRRLWQVPYVGHLLRVAGIVAEWAEDEETVIAAVLHDAIEDQGGPAAREQIRKAFGERVATIVDECSDTDQKPKPPWRERKEAYLAHLKNALPETHLIAAADKLDNIRSLITGYIEYGESLWDHFHGGRDNTLWFYREVVTILEEVMPGPLVRELTRELRQFQKISQQ